MKAEESAQVKDVVRQRYARVAQGSWCGPAVEASCCCPWLLGGGELAKAVGYTAEVDALPESVTQSFAGCGNPVALAGLQEGEIVLDLGAGAGLDVFLAAQRVGDKGRVIGLDMTLEMMQKARQNAGKLGLENVEFYLGDIEDMPIADRSIDVVISNCVINLVPNKGKVFQEAYRVLKPGGRLLVSDIVAEAELLPAVREDLEAWAGCLAGALRESEYLAALKGAGFADVRVVAKARLGPIASDNIEAHRPS